MTLQDGRLILPWPGRVLRSEDDRLRLTRFFPHRGWRRHSHFSVCDLPKGRSLLAQRCGEYTPLRHALYNHGCARWTHEKSLREIADFKEPKSAPAGANYDEILMRTADRHGARAQVRDQINAILRAWGLAGE